jgi:hypothetical protein
MQLPPFSKMMPVKGHQSQSKSKESLAEHEYDVLLLAALYHLALPGRTRVRVVLARERSERFGRRTKKSMTLLVIGSSLSK